MIELLEDLRSQFRAVTEAVTAMPDLIQRRMDPRFERLEERMGRLEDAVRQHSNEIRSLQHGLAEVRQEVSKLRTDLDARDERARLDALEARLSRVEQRIGI